MSKQVNEGTIQTVKNLHMNRKDDEVEYSYIEYDGDIESSISKIKGAKVAIIDKNRAIIIGIGRDVDEIIKELGEQVIYVSPGGIHTLCDITPIDASGVGVLYSKEDLNLDGADVIVGILDTGIDYINKEFINDDGTSRVVAIFDQTNSSGKLIENQPIGSEFSREDINRAILAEREGKNPYEIVPSKDEIGHGTNMAGIIGAKGVNLQLKGVAPRCEFAIVKLATIDERTKDKFCIYGNEPAFSFSSIILGMNYLFKMKFKTGKPMVVFLPFGTNMSGHIGISTSERYIEEISKVRGMTVVIPTGNQGSGDTHTSGEILKQGDTSTIELYVDEKQKNLRFEIWISKPDKYGLSILSPSGEIIERISPKINETSEINFIFEKTKMYVKFSIPEEISGDEKIVIVARNIKRGIWSFKLLGDIVSTGKFNAWLSQKELLAPETRFLRPDPYITLTTPSTAKDAISVGFYGQSFNTLEESSGRGYTVDDSIKPDIVAGGINALTTSNDGGVKMISGSSVAGAVVAGCVALILEWGIIKGNEKGLYSTMVKSYLISGTMKRAGDVYPNPLWGYGAIDMKQVFSNIRGLQEKKRESTSNTKPNYFLEENNRNYIIEYKGDIRSVEKRYPNTAVYIIDDNRAIISTPFNISIDVVKNTPEIVAFDSGSIYELSDISPIDASEAPLFHENEYLPLDGSGVLVGIIDTGIDYLNEEFINDDGKTKIQSIWDLSIEGDIEATGLIQGTVYSKEVIDRAIQAKKNGQDPYSIVPSKDEIGHGTKMAGIISARGVNPAIQGVAPNSELVIVKLKPASSAVREYYGVYGNAVCYRSTTFLLAIRYLYQFASKSNKPIVIYSPLGSNNGAHNGESPLERYIDEVSNYNGIAVVVPTGNQGNSNTHTSGYLKKKGDVGIIELIVGEKQKDIRIEIWISSPDKVSLIITSPTGEITSKIPPKNNEITDIAFLYEETKMRVEYLIPEDITGEEKITIIGREMKAGIWQFKLVGELIVVGRYDAWILQKAYLAPNTRFIKPSPDTTLTIPSTSDLAISVGYYNQNNNSVVVDSGRGYTRNNMIKPDIVAGGIRQLATTVSGRAEYVSGSSVAAAVVAACAALIFQWGIVDGNDTSMYASKVKTYLISGTKKRPGDTYPNSNWGYGMLNLNGTFENVRGIKNDLKREMTSKKTKKINYFLEPNNRGILIEYKGDIVNAMSKYPNTAVYIIDEKRAAITIPINQIDIILKETKEIVYADSLAAFTLSEISPKDSANTSVFNNNIYFNLDGKGVIVGIVDTGIDYLNEEFINEDGTSKILAIWDQNINADEPSDLILGVEYTREDINKAIQAKKNGQDPYLIVPSKDDIGHGTNMAGIISARGINPELRGVAPESELLMVKLKPIADEGKSIYGIYGNVPAFRSIALFTAVRYLYNYSKKYDKPIVIFVPLGTNNGAHDGNSYIERYIQEISNYNGVVVVFPAGNQGNSSTHVSGKIKNTGETSTFELKIDKRQKDIRFEIWVVRPDKVSLSITSPTGEEIKRIVPKIKERITINFIYERTEMIIEYIIPEEITGNEKIIVYAKNIVEGIWQFTLMGDLVTVGIYDAWLLQKELNAPETAFLAPNFNTTLTVPGTATKSITVAYYNQNNNSIVPDSGKGYTRKNTIKPDIAAGGINQTTTGVGGTTQVVSGSSVAAAITAGCCALLFQWGIVNKNDPTMYAIKVKTYLIRGASKREEDTYPNPNWGYGMLDLKGIFDNVRLLEMRNNKKRDSEFYIGNLFIRIPENIYKR
ncbi:S8 family peptidase [Clostridium sp. 'White wine YQ']|uniref:S8 family peptidase n=1 Tax=Clostridium sp. 'White wine YQ' TaxID=3027474 RepID=UPI0023664184|nr:S8 family peptidase [Clostridium sp. 'White wine YQ']MDD7794199.1 S8 family peptidase [Clostridium sp. 'White wine YQ']